MAKKGFGTKFQYTDDGGTTWTDVGELLDVTPPAPSKDVIDTTHHGSVSGTRTKMGGLVDPGQSTLEVQFDPDNTTHQALQTRANTAHEEPQTYRIVYPTSTIIEFDAICTGYSPTVEMDGKLLQSFNFDNSGVVDNDATAQNP